MPAGCSGLGKSLIEYLERYAPEPKPASLRELAGRFDVSSTYLYQLRGEKKNITADRAARYVRLACNEHGYPPAVIIFDPESMCAWVELRVD